MGKDALAERKLPARAVASCDVEEESATTTVLIIVLAVLLAAPSTANALVGTGGFGLGCALASRVARFSRRAGLRSFASLEAVRAFVGNPAERLKGIQAPRRRADTSHARPRPGRTLGVNPSRARRQNVTLAP